MTASVNTFALIGASFPGDTFESLRRASAEAKVERRSRRQVRNAHIWAASRDPIVVPKRLSA